MRFALALIAASFAVSGVSAQDDDLITLGGSSSGPEEAAREAPPPSGLVLRPGGLFFASLDADGDFLISTAERIAGVEAAFATADRNGSGDLSLIEYADFAERALGARDAQPGVLGFDRDQDNRISPAEFRAGFEDLAARLAPEPGAALPFTALVVDREELRAAGRPGGPRRN